jgi:hypothetical protein
MDHYLEPLAVTVDEGVRIIGRSRSEIYRKLASGELRAKKDGKRTLILFESLKQSIANLPDATFTPARPTPHQKDAT